MVGGVRTHVSREYEKGIRMRMPSVRTMTTSVPSCQIRRFEPPIVAAQVEIKAGFWQISTERIDS